LSFEGLGKVPASHKSIRYTASYLDGGALAGAAMVPAPPGAPVPPAGFVPPEGTTGPPGLAWII